MPRLSESERQDRIRARRRLRAALACLEDDLPCLSPARLFLTASIHTIDAVVGEDEPAPGDHDEDTDRYGVADGWHAKDGAAAGALVPVEPYRSAGLRLPARGDCRSAYKPRREFASVNPDVGIVSDPDRCGLPGHHEREC